MRSPRRTRSSSCAPTAACSPWRSRSASRWSQRHPVAGEPGRLPLPRAVLRAALARRALDRGAGAPARADRGRFHAARRPHRRDPRPQGDRGHRVELRPPERPVHAARVRAPRARGDRRPQAQPGLERSVHRRRPAARHQREIRHARRRCTARAARRADAQAPAARGLRRAYLRRPLRAHGLGGRRRCRALRRVAARGRRAAGHAAGRHAHAGLHQHRRRADGAERAGAGARAGRRRDRLQGGQGPRPQPRRALPAERCEHRAPLRRHRRRRAAARCHRPRPPAPVRAADPAASPPPRARARTTSCCCA